MSDVAIKAGVSEKSVSRVVNGEPHVSAALKSKVNQAIEALGYVPDLAARSLAGSRSFMVSLLFDTRGPQYAARLLEGAYDACEASGYHLRVENLDSLADIDSLLGRLEQILRNSRLDGMVLTPPFCDQREIMALLEERSIPFSRVAPFVDPGRSPAAFIDDGTAAAQVADLLLGYGHRRIGLVNGPPEHGAAVARRNGFLRRVREAAPDAEITEVDGNFLFEGGREAGHALLSAERRPTAIFAANDDSAAGLMSVCSELGICVPDDLSVCGFDDSWTARSVWPYLTTIHQPVDEIARAATRLLIEKPEDPDDPQQVKLAHRLVERNSVRRLD